ncbi:MAG: hypothetical protein JZU64_16935, partial [Rhodoferax sp.]|nr:hypothetical protein [Rhodoferax sp.]
RQAQPEREPLKSVPLGYDPILRAIQKVYPAAKIDENFRPNRPVARIQQAQEAMKLLGDHFLRRR